MKHSNSDMVNSNSVTDQLVGQGVYVVNRVRHAHEENMQALQDKAFVDAMEQMQKIHDFVGSPENILGSQATKHGEIAEQVEVGVRNARSALNQEEMTATFEGVPRTAPADYMIDGVEVQSKFINGTNNTLTHVMDHMDKYENFGRDGTYYHIPKDQYSTIDRILKGEEIEGLSPRSIEAIKTKAEEIERLSGKSFDEVIKPGESEYAEVQLGRIKETLDKHEVSLKEQQEARKDQIAQEHQASFADGLKAAGVGALIGGGFSLGTSLYQKYKEGKNVFHGELTEEDWKNVGIDTAKGLVAGGVTAGAIYYLTNFCDQSAPLASAVVSAIKGVGSLAVSLGTGDIDSAAFIELAMFTCAESAVVYIGALAGNAIIPVPVLGTMIGSIASRMIFDFLVGDNKQLAHKMKVEMDSYIKQLDARYQAVTARIIAAFDRLDSLTEQAFDLSINVSLLERSVALAEAHGVPAEKIIRNHDDLNDFILG